MKKEKENFEIIKEPEDSNRNYIFQKDKITKNTSLFVLVVIVLLILAVVLTSLFF